MNLGIKLSIVVLFLGIAVCNAQVTSKKIADKIIDRPITNYDSLHDISNLDDMSQYIGQELYVLPVSDKYYHRRPKMETYMPFFWTAEMSNKSGDVYYPLSSNELASRGTDYNIMAHRYLKVIGVTDWIDSGAKYNENIPGVFLKLRKEENIDITYFSIKTDKYYSAASDELPFIVIGYYEKMKKLHVGKDFLLKSAPEDIYDIKTGKHVNCTYGSSWKCKEINILEFPGYYFYMPAFTMIDSSGQEIAALLNDGVPGYECGFTMFQNKADYIEEQRKLAAIKAEEEKEAARQKTLREQEEAKQEKLRAEEGAKEKEKERKRHLANIKKYGKGIGKLINNGEVIIGMTKDMCKEAIGEPDDFSKTVTRYGRIETWYYHGGNTMLQFKNGRLSTYHSGGG